MAGYCNVCHAPLIEGQYKIIRGKKICKSCLSNQEDTKAHMQREALENDKDKKDLVVFLLKECGLNHAPESWYATIDSLNKKGYNSKKIISTLQYCCSQGKTVSPDGWSALIYIYYMENEERLKQQREVTNYNNNKVITDTQVTVKINPTTYRDLPNYNIEDL